MRHAALTQRITAYNELGFGLSENIYSEALALLFAEAGIAFRREHGIDVWYRDHNIGTYRVDFLVDDTVVVELKTGSYLPLGSRAQLITYLKVGRKRVGLLLFFGPEPDVERVDR